jgi:hypothetical protein
MSYLMAEAEQLSDFISVRKETKYQNKWIKKRSTITMLFRILCVKIGVIMSNPSTHHPVLKPCGK